MCFLHFELAIDSYRGHCKEHSKKLCLRWKLSPCHIFECLCVWISEQLKQWTISEQIIFELPEMAKN